MTSLILLGEFRRDYCRDDRRGRDRAASDRSDRRGERRRSTERKKADSPELPRANKFFDRARKLGKKLTLVNCQIVAMNSKQCNASMVK